MQSSNGLERLGYMLAGATAVVTLVAFLMVRDHVAARIISGRIAWRRRCRLRPRPRSKVAAAVARRAGFAAHATGRLAGLYKNLYK